MFWGFRVSLVIDQEWKPLVMAVDLHSTIHLERDQPAIPGDYLIDVTGVVSECVRLAFIRPKTNAIIRGPERLVTNR